MIMATSGKIICLLAAFCIVAEAQRDRTINVSPKPIQQHDGPPQKQTMFGFPVDQGTGPSVVGPSIGGPSASFSYTGMSSSSSSSEEVSNVDMGMNMGTNEADGAPSFVFGRNRNQISGNLRPMFRGGNRRQRVMAGVEAGDYDQLKGRTTGSSGRGVGIAFGVLGLLTLVVATAFFTIRKYRHDIPVLVRT